MWAPSGKELFYLQGRATMMTVPVQTTSTFVAGNPQKLFAGDWFVGVSGRSYDVTQDGQRFLIVKNTLVGRNATARTITAVVNWTQELKQRVPSK